VWAIQQALHERILLGRCIITQHAGQLSHQAVPSTPSRQFATGQYIITDGNLYIHILADQPLIYALITSASRIKPSSCCATSSLTTEWVSNLPCGGQIHTRLFSRRWPLVAAWLR